MRYQLTFRLIKPLMGGGFGQGSGGEAGLWRHKGRGTRLRACNALLVVRVRRKAAVLNHLRATEKKEKHGGGVRRGGHVGRGSPDAGRASPASAYKVVGHVDGLPGPVVGVSLCKGVVRLWRGRRFPHAADHGVAASGGAAAAGGMLVAVEAVLVALLPHVAVFVVATRAGGDQV